MNIQTIQTSTHLLLVDETGVGFTYNKPTYNGNGKIGKSENRESLAIIAASPKIEGIPEFETLPPNILTFKEWSKNPDRIVDVNRMNCSTDEEYFNNYVNKTLPPNQN